MTNNLTNDIININVNINSIYGLRSSEDIAKFNLDKKKVFDLIKNRSKQKPKTLSHFIFNIKNNTSTECEF